jgi:RsiW-degrading membrane proteinase PrsW (M82 family)
MLVSVVALLGALIPTIFYVGTIWWLDRYEKEPPWLLALAFLWGAFPAAIASVLVELALDIPIAALGGESLVANLASASISAPLVEESAKGIALIGLVLVFRHEFDDVLDGIVYGAMIGFGFAFTENLFAYFLPILREEGIGSGLTNIVLRTLVFGLNHAFWTGIIGAAVGYARLSRDWGRRIVVPFAGWTMAVLLHAIHNAGAALVEQTACLSLGVSLLVDWGGVLLLLSIALLVLRREREPSAIRSTTCCARQDSGRGCAGEPGTAGGAPPTGPWAGTINVPLSWHLRNNIFARWGMSAEIWPRSNGCNRR